MNKIAQQVVDAIKAKSLQDSASILEEMYDVGANVFVIQEAVHWDFKDSFPFSFSDAYFGGIVRLICAFYNTFGGIIIFGIHDASRTPGHNKVKVNVERLNNVLRSIISCPIETVHREYYLEPENDRKKIDLLLVPKRPMGVPPARLISSVGSYKPGTIWMRVGHEVIEPRSVDLPKLYASREDYGMADEADTVEIQSSLPPSPATLKEFVGRRHALDWLYRWLFSSDEPRCFLWGRGGSGKSTIAYEFARMVAETGGGIPTEQGEPIDFVLYLSAKLISLDPLSRTIANTRGHDFSTAQELFRAILLLAGWTSEESIQALDDAGIARELQQLVNTIQLLVVIDDIDTLTTANRDPGMDTLYRLLVRSARSGKVLYTLRNLPTQSIENSKEVEGLDISTELPEFVTACCTQFKVPAPREEFVNGPLVEVTERKPLAIEVLIGLRRTVGSYEEALRLFQGREGDQARSYLFHREYMALPADNRARLFLAALALLGRPAKFPELVAILQFSNEQINDCVSQTLEMFLQTATTASGETTYSLGAATEQFLRDVSKGLERHDKLKANVQYFKSPFLPRQPQMSQLQFEVIQLFNRQDFPRAVELLSRPGYPAAITEHPVFNMLKGRALSKLHPPKYDDARQAFGFAATHGSSDVQGFREWYWMEKDSGFSIFKPMEVCDQVINLKGISIENKSEFLAKKGLAYRDLAVPGFPVDPEKALGYLKEALTSLLAACELPVRGNRDRQSKTDEWLKDAFRFLFICAARSLDAERPDLVQNIFGFFSAEAKARAHHFDASEVPALDCIRILHRGAIRDGVGRNRAFLQRLSTTYEKPFGIKFRDEAARARILASARDAISKLSAR